MGAVDKDGLPCHAFRMDMQTLPTLPHASRLGLNRAAPPPEVDERRGMRVGLPEVHVELDPTVVQRAPAAAHFQRVQQLHRLVRATPVAAAANTWLAAPDAQRREVVGEPFQVCLALCTWGIPDLEHAPDHVALLAGSSSAVRDWSSPL